MPVDIAGKVTAAGRNQLKLPRMRMVPAMQRHLN
jgi:hypothetical protein